MGKLYDAYKICQVRGHEPSGRVLTSSPPWNVCKYCGTGYRIETVVREIREPTEDE